MVLGSRSNLKQVKHGDGVYITQLLEKADKSMSLSYKNKIEDAMFGEVSRIPIFNEFKTEIVTSEFKEKYLENRSKTLEEERKIHEESKARMMNNSKRGK